MPRAAIYIARRRPASGGVPWRPFGRVSMCCLSSTTWKFSRVPATQKIVAVVDDDTSTLKAIERLLSARGFQVETWLSAEAFLASGASRCNSCYWTFTSARCWIGVRRQLANSGCTAPIIFMTGNHDERTRQEALKAGCADFLRKPFSSHILFATIARAIGQVTLSTGKRERFCGPLR